jgi:hypothetical protein
MHPRVLSLQASPVRARCERTAVERCRMTFDERGAIGSVMPILSVGVEQRQAIGWVCKPKVAGSIPPGTLHSQKSLLQVFLRHSVVSCENACERGASGPSDLSSVIAPIRARAIGGVADHCRLFQLDFSGAPLYSKG